MLCTSVNFSVHHSNLFRNENILLISCRLTLKRKCQKAFFRLHIFFVSSDITYFSKPPGKKVSRQDFYWIVGVLFLPVRWTGHDELCVGRLPWPGVGGEAMDVGGGGASALMEFQSGHCFFKTITSRIINQELWCKGDLRLTFSWVRCFVSK